MSYIMQIIRCKNCKSEMNIATGTYGTGIPNGCPYCKKKLEYEVIANGWQADSKTTKLLTATDEEVTK